MEFNYNLKYDKLLQLRNNAIIKRSNQKELSFYKDYKHIIIVRNPYYRCISLFLDKFVYKKDKISNLLTNENISFNQFLNFLQFHKKKKFYIFRWTLYSSIISKKRY